MATIAIMATGHALALPQFITLLAAPTLAMLILLTLAPWRAMRRLAADDSAIIAALAARAEAVAQGDRRIVLGDLALDRNDDLGRLSRALRDLAAEARATRTHARLLSRRIGHHVQQETSRITAHLHREVMTDPLTGVGNRRSLTSQIERLRSRSGEHGPIAIMLIDVDHFKRINDALGHAEGDRCLRFLADTLRCTLRRSDVIVRLGGDEFLTLMPGTTVDHARPIALRLQTMLRQLPWTHALPRPTVSIGLAGGQSADLADNGTLIEQADAALYEAKRQGRNQAFAFTAETCAA
jgi:two-component system cell cycle response regulator